MSINSIKRPKVCSKRFRQFKRNTKECRIRESIRECRTRAWSRASTWSRAKQPKTPSSLSTLASARGRTEALPRRPTIPRIQQIANPGTVAVDRKFKLMMQGIWNNLKFVKAIWIYWFANKMKCESKIWIWSREASRSGTSRRPMLQRHQNNRRMGNLNKFKTSVRTIRTATPSTRSKITGQNKRKILIKSKPIKLKQNKISRVQTTRLIRTILKHSLIINL